MTLTSSRTFLRLTTPVYEIRAVFPILVFWVWALSLSVTTTVWDCQICQEGLGVKWKEKLEQPCAEAAEAHRSAPNEFMSFWKWALSGKAQQNLHNLPFINQGIHSTVRADSPRVHPERLGLNTTNSAKSHSSLPFYIHLMTCYSVI